MSAPLKPLEAARSEARRQQVLDAATACFRQYGFHGASIQRISQAAGMSPGHIYHYFGNKEAIVSGIVEQHLHASLDVMRRMEEASQSIGLAEALVAEVASSIATRPRSRPNALGLEVLAEASRNPEIAAAIQQADKTLRARLREFLLQLPAMKKLPRSELDARVTVMASLFDGLEVRALSDPAMSKAATTRVMQQVFRMLIDG